MLLCLQSPANHTIKHHRSMNPETHNDPTRRKQNTCRVQLHTLPCLPSRICVFTQILRSIRSQPCQGYASKGSVVQTTNGSVPHAIAEPHTRDGNLVVNY